LGGKNYEKEVLQYFCFVCGTGFLHGHAGSPVSGARATMNGYTMDGTDVKKEGS